MTQQISTWKLGVGPTWGAWQPTGAPVDVDALAARLADGPRARDQVSAPVLAFDTQLRQANALVLQAGVWVPDRRTGHVAATMFLELRTGASSAEQFLATARTPPRIRGIKLLHHDSAPAVVATGPAVVVTRAHTTRRTRLVVHTIEWTIFPPGTTDAVQLTFSTPAAELAEALAAESADVVNRLTVTLGPQV